MRVEDPLREPGRARGVVELGGVLGERVDPLEARVALVDQALVEHEDVLDRQAEGTHALGVLGVGDEDLRLRVRHAVPDPVVAVEHREREQDRACLERPEERRGRLGPRRQQHRDAIAGLDAVLSEDAREPGARLLELAPHDLRARCRGSPPTASPACRAGACRRRPAAML